MKPVFIIAAFAVALAGCSETATAKKEVAALLRDPSSAQFTEVTRSGHGEVCGFVNGKNAYGAYAGATKFVWSASGAEIASNTPSGNVMIDASKSCELEEAWRVCKAGLSGLTERLKRQSGPNDICQTASDDAFEARYGFQRPR